MQGTADDGFKLALIYLGEKLKDSDAQIVHILHDEIIVEAKVNIAYVMPEPNHWRWAKNLRIANGRLIFTEG